MSTTHKQTYQNDYAFRPNKGSKKSRQIHSLPTGTACEKCREIIEWRKKFQKYKPLTEVKKCIKCELKKVKFAYHTVCEDCVVALKICGKCAQPFTQEELEKIEKRKQRKLDRLNNPKPKKSEDDDDDDEDDIN